MNRTRQVPDLIPLLVIFGPTSSGKTALSLRPVAALKNELGVTAEIIGADSRQVHAGMNIGTAKVGREVMMRVPHHCVDLRPPDRKLSLAEYQAEAVHRIKEIHQRGHLPVVVGGTGTYASCVAENWRASEMPGPGERNSRAAGKGPPLFRVMYLRPAISLQRVMPRIDKAVEAMFAAGLVEEVTALAERYRL